MGVREAQMQSLKKEHPGDKKTHHKVARFELFRLDEANGGQENGLPSAHGSVKNHAEKHEGKGGSARDTTYLAGGRLDDGALSLPL